jgi:hypothetical protein
MTEKNDAVHGQSDNPDPNYSATGVEETKVARALETLRLLDDEKNPFSLGQAIEHARVLAEAYMRWEESGALIKDIVVRLSDGHEVFMDQSSISSQCGLRIRNKFEPGTVLHLWKKADSQFDEVQLLSFPLSNVDADGYRFEKRYKNCQTLSLKVEKCDDGQFEICVDCASEEQVLSATEETWSGITLPRLIPSATSSLIDKVFRLRRSNARPAGLSSNSAHRSSRAARPADHDAKPNHIRKQIAAVMPLLAIALIFILIGNHANKLSDKSGVQQEPAQVATLTPNHSEEKPGTSKGQSQEAGTYPGQSQEEATVNNSKPYEDGGKQPGDFDLAYARSFNRQRAGSPVINNPLREQREKIMAKSLLPGEAPASNKPGPIGSQINFIGPKFRFSASNKPGPISSHETQFVFNTKPFADVLPVEPVMPENEYLNESSWRATAISFSNTVPDGRGRVKIKHYMSEHTEAALPANQEIHVEAMLSPMVLPELSSMAVKQYVELLRKNGYKASDGDDGQRGPVQLKVKYESDEMKAETFYAEFNVNGHRTWSTTEGCPGTTELQKGLCSVSLTLGQEIMPEMMKLKMLVSVPALNYVRGTSPNAGANRSARLSTGKVKGQGERNPRKRSTITSAPIYGSPPE